MSEPGRFIPPVSQLRAVADAILAFSNQASNTPVVPWMCEDEYLPLFIRLDDHLQSLRPLLDQAEGWDYEPIAALRRCSETLDAVARAWGWEPLLSPGPERSKFLEAQRARFRETKERPLFECACSWAAGRRKMPCPANVKDFARLGQAAGFQAAMSPDEGRAGFEAARLDWEGSTRIGTCRPELTYEQRCALESVHLVLDSALMEVEAPAVIKTPPSKPLTPATARPDPDRNADGGSKTYQNPNSNIPSERRTIPLGILQAARLMWPHMEDEAGRKALRKSVRSGTTAAIRKSARTWQFDINEFPSAARERVTPQPPKPSGTDRD